MAKRTREASKPSKGDFMQLIKAIPVEQFVRMVTKSGLPTDQARDLCQQFKALKS